MDSIITTAMAEVADSDFGIDAASLELRPQVRIGGEMVDRSQSVAVPSNKQIDVANHLTEVETIRSTAFIGAPRCIHR